MAYIDDLLVELAAVWQELLGQPLPDSIANQLRNHSRNTIKIPCPRCQRDGKDSKGDNLNVTPAKRFAKCFKCQLSVQPYANPLYRETLRALEAHPTAKQYLESRNLTKALDTRQIGFIAEAGGDLVKNFPEQYSQLPTVSQDCLCFWSEGQIVKLRPINGKNKALNLPNQKIAPFIVRTSNNKNGWIITEGEMDALAAYCTFGEDYNYLSTSGASNTKLPDLVTGDIILIPDNDEAGEAWADEITQYRTARIATLPPEYKDLNEAIGHNYKTPLPHDELTAIIDSAQTKHRPAHSVVAQVSYILEDKKQPSRQRKIQIANIILEELLSRGKFLEIWGTTYYFDDASAMVCPVGAGERWNALIARYGVLRGEDTFTIVTEYIMAEVINREIRQEVDAKVMAHYCPAQRCLYIDKKDGSVIKLTNSHEYQQRNADEVLFYRGKKEKPLTIDKDTQGRDYLWELLQTFTLESEEARKLLYCWVLGVVFNGFFETKPLLLLQSAAGSGKTTLAKTIGRILVGEHFNVSAMPENIDSFMAVLHKNPYLVFDNAEKIDPKMFDHIAIAATGATFQKRKLYSEFDTVSARSNAWLCFTMITNNLRRKDIVERALLIKMDRIKEFRSTRELKELYSPSKIWGSIYHASQEILRAITENKHPPTGTKLRKVRMADFAEFVYLVCNVKKWDSDILADWWLTETAEEALDDNIYADVVMAAINKIRLLSPPQMFWKDIEEQVAIKINSGELSYREQEILKAWKSKQFWGWLKNQASNFEEKGIRIDVKKNSRYTYAEVWVEQKEQQDFENVLDAGISDSAQD